MSTALQRVKSAKKSMSFLEFCKEKEAHITRSLSEIASCIPKEMYENDNRMDIGKFVCHELDRDFDVLKAELSYGYDMLYNDDKKISIKFNKTNTFQGVGRNIRLTKPKNIVVKNFHTVKQGRKVKLNDFDYLWSISYKVVPKGLFFGSAAQVIYGVATRNTIQDHLVEKSKSDHQLKVRLNNNEWDYCSGYKLVEGVDLDEDLNSYNYKMSDELRWNLLRQSNK